MLMSVSAYITRQNKKFIIGFKLIKYPYILCTMIYMLAYILYFTLESRMIMVGLHIITSVSVSVYNVAVRTIVLSRHGSNLARPVIIHDIIHGLYVPSTPCCGLFGVSPDGNCAYFH